MSNTQYYFEQFNLIKYRWNQVDIDFLLVNQVSFDSWKFATEVTTQYHRKISPLFDKEERVQVVSDAQTFFLKTRKSSGLLDSVELKLTDYLVLPEASDSPPF